MPDTPITPTERPVHFLHRGQLQQVGGLPPTTTVLQWLRGHAHCTGSKEGCAEGDCGACTVVVATPDAQAPGGVRLDNVNACIQFLPTLDGKALYTVEDVAPTPDTLHPCQQALVQCHGSQCGFCTPGFVMSMWQLYQAHDQAPPREALADALSGNLCRCTGYRPILDAAQQMFDAPRQVLDTAPVAQALAALPDSTLVLGREPGQRFIAPRSLAEFAQWRAALPEARILAGATDIGLWVNKQFRTLGDILYVGQVPELRAITPWADGKGLSIGAAASLEAAWSALAERLPALKELWLRFASPPVRRAGTLGGNVANGSPIGDAPPVLLALGAELVLRHGEHTRRVPLSGFYLDYMKNDLQPGEFLQSIEVPWPTAGQMVRAYKVSKRRDSDISAVCAAFGLTVEHGVITEARVAYGGMAATARRAALVEQALVGHPWNEATVQRAQAALAQDFTPLSDLRASQGYRQQVAANLIRRCWLETRPQAPMAGDQVEVWPAVV
ncbi:xanthine dehydrogenase small subunit [Aquabacterium lacunae]|uniref:Xanthine dehydrogenase small subunit n=1 Tax=Aquabacterium lacunae TaxID=2528630 RepID=A0A4V2JFX9_9BURK|nr:xanthine dehydrogenase small subunit [Aquabacterium lacunae]TBO32536.1 xanthine dehydrogenase small subunit [Aquabacterium lacunae]